MKKLFFLVLTLTVIGLTANAQRGSILLGGSIDILISKNAGAPNDSKSSNFNFSATVGYQINDN